MKLKELLDVLYPFNTAVIIEPDPCPTMYVVGRGAVLTLLEDDELISKYYFDREVDVAKVELNKKEVVVNIYLKR